jgi:hypothetical protein
MKEPQFVYRDPNTGDERNVRFATGALYTSDGVEFTQKCKCEKEGNVIIGKSAFIVRCENCLK